jgi:hypothetical protein
VKVSGGKLSLRLLVCLEAETQVHSIHQGTVNSMSLNLDAEESLRS